MNTYRTDVRHTAGGLSFRFLDCDGMTGFLDAVRQGRLDDPRSDVAFARNCRSHEFIGRDDLTPETADAAVWQGWPEGERRAREMRDKLVNALDPVGQSFRRKRCRSEFDGEVNSDRLFGPTFDVYDTSTREKRTDHTGVVRLVCGMGARAYVSWEQMVWRAVATAVLCERLEATGRRVQIDGVRVGSNTYSYPGPSTGAFRVIVKSAGTPLDLSMVVSCLSAWAYRTLGFASCHAVHPNRVNSSYGSTDPTTIDHLRAMGYREDDEFVLIDNVFNESAALDLIREHSEVSSNG